LTEQPTHNGAEILVSDPVKLVGFQETVISVFGHGLLHVVWLRTLEHRAARQSSGGSYFHQVTEKIHQSQENQKSFKFWATWNDKMTIISV
jgi:hypothetical protein